MTLFNSLFLTNHYALCWDNLKDYTQRTQVTVEKIVNQLLITDELWYYCDFTLTTEKEVVDAVKRHMRD